MRDTRVSPPTRIADFRVGLVVGTREVTATTREDRTIATSHVRTRCISCGEVRTTQALQLLGRECGKCGQKKRGPRGDE